MNEVDVKAINGQISTYFTENPIADFMSEFIPLLEKYDARFFITEDQEGVSAIGVYCLCKENEVEVRELLLLPQVFTSESIRKDFYFEEK